MVRTFMTKLSPVAYNNPVELVVHGQTLWWAVTSDRRADPNEPKLERECLAHITEEPW